MNTLFRQRIEDELRKKCAQFRERELALSEIEEQLKNPDVSLFLSDRSNVDSFFLRFPEDFAVLAACDERCREVVLSSLTTPIAKTSAYRLQRLSVFLNGLSGLLQLTHFNEHVQDFVQALDAHVRRLGQELSVEMRGMKKEKKKRLFVRLFSLGVGGFLVSKNVTSPLLFSAFYVLGELFFHVIKFTPHTREFQERMRKLISLNIALEKVQQRLDELKYLSFGSAKTPKNQN